MARKQALTERLNNPLAIKDFGDNWLGKVDSETTKDGRKFVKFSEPAYGIRAAIRILWRYEDRGVIMSVAGVIKEWTATEREVYLQRVEDLTGWDSSKKIDLKNGKEIYTLLKAMHQVEAGYSWVKPGDWEKGFRMVGLKLRPALFSKRLIGAQVASMGAIMQGATEQFQTFNSYIDPELASYVGGSLLIVGLFTVGASWFFDRVK